MKREWDFGTFLPTITIDNGVLYWKLIGNGSGSYPLQAVNGVQYTTEFLTANLIILVSGGLNKPLTVKKEDKTRQRIEEINSFIHEQKKAFASATPAASVADELRKLAELRDAGILTDDEFNQQKTKLLNR